MVNMIEQRYREQTQKSYECFQKSRKYMPGGDTRTTAFHRPYPLFIKEGKGSKLTDVDGNIYLDAINNYTAMIHGHSHPIINENVMKAVEKGISFASGIEEQITLAEILCKRVSSIESIRFTNSGSEASLFAIRAARAYTNKMGIISITGGYHGTHDFVAQYHDKSEIHGIPSHIEKDQFKVPFNDINAMETVLKEHHSKIAAIIIEPVLGAGGIIVPKNNYLQNVQKLTKKYDVLLILDEVQTLRIDYGGAQKSYEIQPDITILGKVIGGGYPIGAFGGKKEIMNQFNPSSNHLSHGGTFNGNRASMAAGIAAMDMLTNEKIHWLNKQASLLKKQMLNKTKEQSIPVSITRAGSLLNIHFSQKEPENTDEIYINNKEKNSLLHLEMLNQGVFIAPRGSFNLSTAWSEEDIDYFISAFTSALKKVNSYFMINN